MAQELKKRNDHLQEKLTNWYILQATGKALQSFSCPRSLLMQY